MLARCTGWERGWKEGRRCHQNKSGQSHAVEEAEKKRQQGVEEGGSAGGIDYSGPGD